MSDILAVLAILSGLFFALRALVYALAALHRRVCGYQMRVLTPGDIGKE